MRKALLGATILKWIKKNKKKKCKYVTNRQDKWSSIGHFVEVILNYLSKWYYISHFQNFHKKVISISDRFRSRRSPAQNSKSTICIGGSCALYITRPCQREQSRYSSSMCPVILRSKSQSFERRELLQMYGGYHCLLCPFFTFLLSNSNEFGYRALDMLNLLSEFGFWIVNESS